MALLHYFPTDKAVSFVTTSIVDMLIVNTIFV